MFLFFSESFHEQSKENRYVGFRIKRTANLIVHLQKLLFILLNYGPYILAASLEDYASFCLSSRKEWMSSGWDCSGHWSSQYL